MSSFYFLPFPFGSHLSHFEGAQATGGGQVYVFQHIVPGRSQSASGARPEGKKSFKMTPALADIRPQPDDRHRETQLAEPSQVPEPREVIIK